MGFVAEQGRIGVSSAGPRASSGAERWAMRRRGFGPGGFLRCGPKGCWIRRLMDSGGWVVGFAAGADGWSFGDGPEIPNGLGLRIGPNTGLQQLKMG